MNTASHSSQFKHQVSCSQEEKKGLLFYTKRSKMSSCAHLPLPFPCLLPRPFWVWDPRWLPMHPGPTVATDVPLRNTEQQSRALFLGS